MRIVHIADVHWRGLSRHEEYTKSFSEFFRKCKDLQPDVIYVGGDIVHSKTQGISPELIDRLSWWFTSLSEICPVHVILGNHDGLILNKDRQDAITPIINALDNPNIHLYKDSGVYDTGFDGFKWCVFSCFDEEGWGKVEPVEDNVNIALFHGAVWGSKTDIDWEIEGDVTVDLRIQVPVTGIEVTTGVGSVTVTGGTGVDVPVTGVEATGLLGPRGVTVWGRIVPDETAVWTKIAPSTTTEYTQIRP